MIDREKVAKAIWLASREVEMHVPKPFALADAAIAEVLRQVEANLSAVQYDPAPYTALKHRLRALFPTSTDSSNPAE